MFILISVVIVNLLRGGKGADSIISIKSCSVFDWLIQVFYLAVCVLVTYLGVKRVIYETELKKKYAEKRDSFQFDR